MQSLHAEVHDSQQRRHLRQQAESSTSQDTRLRRKRGLAGNSRREGTRGDLFSRENRGVRERETRDRDQQQEGTRGRRADKVTLALQAKARIYDELQHQRQQCGLEDSDEGLSSGAKACQEVLVDFGKKRKEEAGRKRGGEGAASLEYLGGEDDYSDIEDEFGRERRVLRSSEEYKRNQQRARSAHKRQRQRPPDALRELGPGPGYVWDIGGEMAAEQQERESAREFLNEVRQEIREAYQQEGEKEKNRVRDRGSGGVRSQWDEKVLRGEEREHLLAVHQRTQLMRQHHQQQQQQRSLASLSSVTSSSPPPVLNAAKSGEGEGDGLKGLDSGGVQDEATSNVNIDNTGANTEYRNTSKKPKSNSTLDKRREMLRLKQLEFKKISANKNV